MRNTNATMFLTNSAKGVATMLTINKAFNIKAIIEKVDDLIGWGFKSYSALDDHEKDLLAAECIKANGDESYGCIIDCEDFTKTLTHFRNYLVTADMDEAYELLRTMRTNAVNYYADMLDEMFEQRIEERKQWAKSA